jgi:hypothetical protein
VQEDAGHPGLQGGGHEKNNQEKWRVEEEETPQKLINFTRDSIQSDVAENSISHTYVGKFIISLNNLKLKFNVFCRQKIIMYVGRSPMYMYMYIIYHITVTYVGSHIVALTAL